MTVKCGDRGIGGKPLSTSDVKALTAGKLKGCFQALRRQRPGDRSDGIRQEDPDT
jgi:hypothetical protein